MSRLADVSADVVRIACDVSAHAQNSFTGTGTLKDDKSPVTKADLAVQVIVAHLLRSSSPSIPMLGEEDAGVFQGPAAAELMTDVIELVHRIDPQLTERDVIRYLEEVVEPSVTSQYWILDPIDGTKGFLRGDHYAIALALYEEGEIKVGSLGCPNLKLEDEGDVGAILSASRNQGAWFTQNGCTNRRVLTVSGCDDTSRASLCESVERAHSSHTWSSQVASALSITRPPYRIDSQCKYAAIAAGKADIYLRLPTRAGYVEKVWDHAAGDLIVREAAGRVTDIHGNPLDYSTGRALDRNQGVVATNGKLHTEVIAAIQATLSAYGPQGVE